MQIQTSHFNTSFSNCFSSFTKKWTSMSNVLYFISEIPSLYVFVWKGGSPWHNHLPKCAKMHFSEFQILKFSRWKPPVSPPMGGGHPHPIPSPPLRQRCVEGAEAPYIALTATQFHSPSTWKFGENPEGTLWIEQSGFKPWPRTLCCALGQDTLLLQCLSPPRWMNGNQQI